MRLPKIFPVLFALLLGSQLASAQGQRHFATLDWRVESLDAPTPDSLARLLTTFCTTDLDKTRAIFTWITGHIAYNTGIVTRRAAPADGPTPWDTLSVWRSGVEMTAMKVLYRRMGVCDGYAKLFQTLCDYAGVRCVIITGYARCPMDHAHSFRSNHSWNAVFLEGRWQLLDVTWASGYVDGADQFVQRRDERYFLTPPLQFLQDHYPEDLRWTLIDHAPTPREFRQTPFRYKSFVKYGIEGFSPSCGTVEARVGDTLRFSIDTRSHQKNAVISSDPFFDSTLLIATRTHVLLPPDRRGGGTGWTYVLKDPAVEWISLLYNGDLVLRYRVQIRKEDEKQTPFPWELFSLYFR